MKFYKKILFLLCIITIFNIQFIYAGIKISDPEELRIMPKTSVSYTKKEGSELDKNDIVSGPNRIVKIIKNCKNIDSTVKESYVQIGDNGIERYKITLESDNPTINGIWIVNLVPFTAENMSISKAKSINSEYKWWYTIYENNKPYAIAWARYGH